MSRRVPPRGWSSEDWERAVGPDPAAPGPVDGWYLLLPSGRRSYCGPCGTNLTAFDRSRLARLGPDDESVCWLCDAPVSGEGFGE